MIKMKVREKTVAKNSIRNLTISAIFIALASGLSLIKIIQLPIGGSVTLLSMLPIIMIAYKLGLGWGVGSAFVYSLVQLALGLANVLSWGLTPLSLAGTIFLDYILPFTGLGLAALFANGGDIKRIMGVVAVMVLRFLCHFVSGIIIFDIWCEWDNVWLYSLCYNGSYMLLELVITAVSFAVLSRMPQIKRLMKA